MNPAIARALVLALALGGCGKAESSPPLSAPREATSQAEPSPEPGRWRETKAEAGGDSDDMPALAPTSAPAPGGPMGATGAGDAARLRLTDNAAPMGDVGEGLHGLSGDGGGGALFAGGRGLGAEDLGEANLPKPSLVAASTTALDQAPPAEPPRPDARPDLGARRSGHKKPGTYDFDDSDPESGKDLAPKGALEKVVAEELRAEGGKERAGEELLAEADESELPVVAPDKPAVDPFAPEDARRPQAATKGRGGKRANRAPSRPHDVGDLVQALASEQVAEPRPAKVLPRMFYFENTYLGGNAAVAERLRRLDEALAQGAQPYRLAEAAPQRVDAPDSAGLRLTASLSRGWLDKPGRVYLQVGLTGSERYGWRRPPLDVVLVIDAAALAAPQDAVEALISLLRRLGPQDRLGLVVVGATPRVLAAPDRLRTLRTTLARALEGLGSPERSAAASLGQAVGKAGELLRAAAADTATIPGTQTVLLLTRGADPQRVGAATAAAHQLTVQGIVTSVVELGAAPTHAWWSVANAGHGNYHRVADGRPDAAVAAELDSLSKVVARLIRINVRLGQGVDAIRVLGSRPLEADEVKAVKAREVATDRNLSKTLGVSADRGDDDDGIQTVIPYFYGGDTHVVVIELWVARPGAVADVTLRYKDMVNLRNATARTSVDLAATQRGATPVEVAVQRSVRGLQLAEELKAAAHRLRRGQVSAAAGVLQRARAQVAPGAFVDARMLDSFQELLRRAQRGQITAQVAAEALQMAGERKVGLPAEHD